MRESHALPPDRIFDINQELPVLIESTQPAAGALLLKAPIGEKRVLERAKTALWAENEVKKKHMRLLIRLRNVPTAEQIDYLESIYGK